MGVKRMKRIFTICVPDDCYLKTVNIVTLVEKKDNSANGVTICTINNLNDEEQEWLFNINSEAKQIKEVIEDDEIPAFKDDKQILNAISEKGN